MSDQSAPRIAAYILDSMVETIMDFVETESSNMISVIGPAAAACMTMYIIFWGVAIATGRASEPFSDGIRRILKMCLVIIFALSAGTYQSAVADFFLEVPSSVAVSVAGNIKGVPSEQCQMDDGGAQQGPSSLAKPIDTSLCMGIEVGKQAWRAADSAPGIGTSIGYKLLAIIIYMAVAVVGALAVSVVFISFISLAVLLAIGPLFILATLFEQTQKFFELWLGQVINFGILFILVACVMTLSFTVFDAYLGELSKGDWTDLLVNTVKLVVASIAVGSVLTQTRSMASSLGGGIAMAGQNVTGRLGAAARNGLSRAATAGRNASSSAGRAGASGISNIATATPMGRAAKVGTTVVNRARQTFSNRGG